MTFVHVGVQLHAPGTTIRHVLVRCLDGQAASEWYDFIPCHDIHTSTVILSLHGSRASGMTPHTIIYTHAGVIPSNHGNMPAVFIRYESNSAYETYNAIPTIKDSAASAIIHDDFSEQRMCYTPAEFVIRHLPVVERLLEMPVSIT
ncbi:hypothetical protein M514_21122 [Trichuris suis]|uniref:Uncharacterized protein n=1 Tax=Trichuris suis TaxID=68888 RepID=A0A085NBC7_9BILA|nr:hypothetical protein M514_21122 [Trichuris suis]